ncbi:hypothetical protein BJ322DRAFT_1020918 [Thelephora terrestris]|uniref:Uncharacterized protein n=1 Tax=Thelephora terrestris TaxID=56493 RepID=A0A9P6L7D0_9AGAM|nr:hypothetical protein BJ322DRAFT_1020918 [Thelephora terrestris]
MSGQEQEVHGNLVIVSDVGGSIVQVLLHVEGSIRLEGQGEVEGGGGGVEKSGVGSKSRHSRCPKRGDNKTITHQGPNQGKQTLSSNRDPIKLWEIPIDHGKSPLRFYYYCRSREIPIDHGKSQHASTTTVKHEKSPKSPFSDLFSMGHGACNGDKLPWVMGRATLYNP